MRSEGTFAQAAPPVREGRKFFWMGRGAAEPGQRGGEQQGRASNPPGQRQLLTRREQWPWRGAHLWGQAGFGRGEAYEESMSNIS